MKENKWTRFLMAIVENSNKTGRTTSSDTRRDRKSLKQLTLQSLTLSQPLASISSLSHSNSHQSKNKPR